MAITFSASGTVFIGSTTVTDKTLPFNFNSGTITKHTSGVIAIASATPGVATTIDFGDITTLSGLYLRATLNGSSDLSMVDIITNLSTSSVGVRCSELLLGGFSSPNITALWARPDSGVSVDLEFILAGI